MPGRANRIHARIRALYRNDEASTTSLGLHFMKTKAIVATLLVAAAASVDARFAWPYPRKALSPDEIGHWVVINGIAWSHDVESELATASPSGGGPDGLKSSPTKGKMPHVAERSP
jgi:hypothetical protein